MNCKGILKSNSAKSLLPEVHSDMGPTRQYWAITLSDTSYGDQMWKEQLGVKAGSPFCLYCASGRLQGTPDYTAAWPGTSALPHIRQDGRRRLPLWHPHPTEMQSFSF